VDHDLCTAEQIAKFFFNEKDYCYAKEIFDYFSNSLGSSKKHYTLLVQND
jgi:hypothetical protein